MTLKMKALLKVDNFLYWLFYSFFMKLSLIYSWTVKNTLKDPQSYGTKNWHYYHRDFQVWLTKYYACWDEWLWKTND